MKTLRENLGISLLVVGALLVFALVLFSEGIRQAYGNVTTEQPARTNTLVTYQFFATSTNQATTGLYATSTTATSTNITSWFDSNGRLDNGSFDISGAKKVVFYFDRGDKLGGGNTGSHTFRVQVSPNGSDWTYFERFINATSTGAMATPGSIAGTTTLMAAMDLDYSSFKFVRCIAVETTDGSAECKLQAEY